MPNFRFHTLDVTNSLLGTGLKALLPKCTFRTAPPTCSAGQAQTALPSPNQEAARLEREGRGEKKRKITKRMKNKTCLAPGKYFTLANMFF